MWGKFMSGNGNCSSNLLRIKIMALSTYCFLEVALCLALLSTVTTEDNLAGSVRAINRMCGSYLSLQPLPQLLLSPSFKNNFGRWPCTRRFGRCLDGLPHKRLVSKRDMKIVKGKGESGKREREMGKERGSGN